MSIERTEGVTKPDIEYLMANLEKANEIRSQRAKLRVDLAKMDTTEACRLLADRLTGEMGTVGTLKVEQMLLAIRGVGKGRARLLARAAGNTALTERVSNLPEFRRHELARVLLDRASELERRAAA